MPFDLLAELGAVTHALDAANIDYAVCGGVALAIHGVPRATQDIDLLARQADLGRLRDAVHPCGFVFESLPMTFSSSGVTVHRFVKPVEQQPLMLDVLFAEGPLAAVWGTREKVRWEGGEVSVVSRAGLNAPVFVIIACIRCPRLSPVAALVTSHHHPIEVP